MRSNSFFGRLTGLLCPLVVFGLCLGAQVTLAAARDDAQELHRLREEKRNASRQLQVSKNRLNSPATFSLLVIPVDFADARLQETWTGQNLLAPSLFGAEGHTLENYFRIASHEKLDLQITLAPLVHMTGSRFDYHDIPLTGYSRTRALATEALHVVAQQGLEFRRLDNDGPDGIAGSADDDGQVDGVFILHSGIGQENDSQNGLITPLQFFLKEPVESQGILASFYAVASLQSGLGIWAHETGHLLGMEDRYDPLLHPAPGGSDVRSYGGLGRFSLMASGAWGTDNGLNPALPDAYSCWQLGWLEAESLPHQSPQEVHLTPWRSGGTPVRVWSDGQSEEEFFLLETRDPTTTSPFDAGIPRGQLLIYHVDETVPEGSIGYDANDQYHLRVRLVEADNDQHLRLGLDDGRQEDCFPGPLNITALTPVTAPGSAGYDGPSHVYLEGFQSREDTVSMIISASVGAVLDLQFSVGAGDPRPLEIMLESRGLPFTNLSCVLTLSGDAGVEFSDGTQVKDFSLQPSDGFWIPTEPIFISGPTDPHEGTTTEFHFLFTADSQDLPEEVRSWVWVADPSVFDFQNPQWVFWDQEIPPDETGTRWHLWNQAPFLTNSGSAVLACTADEFTNSDQWPDVQYARRARAALVSPPLGPEVRAVQLIHAIEVEHLHAGTVLDGGVIFWQGSDGSLIPANPVDGWDAVISAQSNNPLAGHEALADSTLILDEEDHPQWRCDVIGVPQDGGPWRLRLEFSSNYMWRLRGWFVAEMLPLDVVPDSAFPVLWDPRGNQCPGGLFWEYPSPTTDFIDPVLEYFDVQSGQYVPLETLENEIRPHGTGFFVPGNALLSSLPQGGLNRNQVRLRSRWQGSVVASGGAIVFADGGAAPLVFLEQPFPNPSTDGIKFLVDIPESQGASLRIFDLRGRMVFQQDFPSGRQQVFWQGTDSSGRRLAAGSYYLKLEGSGFSSTRKVVLIR